MTAPVVELRSSSFDPASESAPLGQFIDAAVRLSLLSLTFILVFGIALECVLRLAGMQPLNLSQAGLSATVPDGFTQLRLRPNVEGAEWVQTNGLGMHDPRPWTSLARTPGVARVAVVGSSVVYGLGQNFDTTIPASLEAELKQRGVNAEVLNFGTQGFNIVNASAMLQDYVQQVRPDVVVIVVDLQMGFPVWPSLVPADTDTSQTVVKLSPVQAALKQAAQYSDVLTLIDDGTRAQAWITSHVNLPLAPAPAPTISVVSASQPARAPAPAVDAAGGLACRAKDVGADIAAYARCRHADLGAPVAAAAAFGEAHNFRVYFVSPYGPYFQASDAYIDGYLNLNMLGESQQVYGSKRAALVAETQLITQILGDVSQQYHGGLIDMLDASRQTPMDSPYFSAVDSVHPTAAGNVHFGQVIADQLIADGAIPPQPGS